MAKDDKVAELALNLGFAMTEMKMVLRQKIQSKINEYDTTFSYELLEIIGLVWRNKTGINQQEIATLISKDKSSVTYLINNLVKRELVKRIENTEDRRNKQIHLTEKGEEMMKTVFPWALELHKKAAENINQDEIANTLNLIKKMTSNLIN